MVPAPTGTDTMMTSGSQSTSSQFGQQGQERANVEVAIRVLTDATAKRLLDSIAIETVAAELVAANVTQSREDSLAFVTNTARGLHKVLMDSARTDIVLGLLIAGGAALISLVTYEAASSNPSGGTYFVLYGAVAYGVIRFINGISKGSKAARLSRIWSQSKGPPKSGSGLDVGVTSTSTSSAMRKSADLYWMPARSSPSPSNTRPHLIQSHAQERLTTAQFQDFGLRSAAALLMSDAGRKANYWQQSRTGEPEVSGSAFAIGSYTWFVMGCAVAGISSDYQKDQAFRLPTTQSLATYYLAIPSNKHRLDAHFAKSDEYLRTKEPGLKQVVGDTKAMLLRSGSGTQDETLIAILWELIGQEKPRSRDEATQGFSTFFNFGLWLDPDEVTRLWGIQIKTTVVATMNQPLHEVRANLLSEARALLAIG